MLKQLRNIEIKFTCDDLVQLRARANKMGARGAGVLHQIDTYFNVPAGRLKLRQTRGRLAMLISYHRPTQRGTRDSDYRLVPVPHPAALKAALAETIGVHSVVRKRRELLLYKNVRIHLDRVHGLGNFGELEAVVGKRKGDDERSSRKRIAKVIAALKIEPSQMLGGSYGEMIAGKSK